jgi:uncharacterized membrane protein (DUF485 family)
MGRLRTFGVSLAVATAVFVYLALPLLQRMFGEWVNIPVYAGIALLAGAITWAVVSGLSSAVDDDPAGVRARREFDRDADDEETTEAGPDPDVETEMEQLKEDL